MSVTLMCPYMNHYSSSNSHSDSRHSHTRLGFALYLNSSVIQMYSIRIPTVVQQNSKNQFISRRNSNKNNYWAKEQKLKQPFDTLFTI